MHESAHEQTCHRRKKRQLCNAPAHQVLTLRPPPADTHRACGDNDDVVSPPDAEGARGVAQKPVRRMECAAPPEKEEGAEEEARAAIPVVGILHGRTGGCGEKGGRQSG